MTPNKSQYILDHLGCANCAAKMEVKLTLEDEVAQATINFVTKKLTIEHTSAPIDSDQLLQKIQGVVSSIESNVVVTPLKNYDSENKGQSQLKSNLTRKDSIFKILTLFLGTIICSATIIANPSSYLFLVFLLLGYFILSYEVIFASLRNIIHGELFDENFLMLIATIGALIIGEYPEAIAVMLLYQIGELFQDLAVDKSRKHLEAAMNIKPEYANVQTPDGLEKVSPESVKLGDIIVIKPSEKIPLDGIVTQGTSFIDSSSLTGESLPRKASLDDEVLSGCINGSGTLFLRVTKIYKDSTVSKVLELIETASNRKSKTVNFITKFAKIYTPIVVLGAFLIAILPPLLTGSYDFSPWIYKACGFLVVSCPCALVISVPLGFFGGIGCASKNGIIVKGGNYLEALSQVDTIVFDKTGTLTQGTFQVSQIHLEGSDYTEDTLLHFAALAESFSTHPIATSIITAYNKPLDTSTITAFEEIAGQGIRAYMNESILLVGNSKLLYAHNIDFSEPVDVNGTIVYLSLDDYYIGYIVISDIIRSDALKTISMLKQKNIKTVLLTGDLEKTANLVGNALGIDQIYAELLPTDKVSKLESFISQKPKNKNIAFVGDGINDAPVIARADIGIAMGGVGSDAAVEAADIVIMNDEPYKIVAAITIAKQTRKIVSQNIYLALGIKLLVLILLAIGYSSLWLAVFADVGVSLLAILNSIRVLKTKII